MVSEIFTYHRRRIMTKERMDYYKELLINERKEIMQELTNSDETARDLFETDSNNVNDSVDDASFTVAQNILSILSKKSQQSLLSIESALRRVEEGTFGACVSCGNEINENRLTSIPWATLCIDCKNNAEKRK